MNLADLVDAVEREIQYAPNSDGYKRNIRRAVSSAYEQIYNEARWAFREAVWIARTFPAATFTEAEVLSFDAPRKLGLQYDVFDIGGANSGDLLWALRGNRVSVSGTAVAVQSPQAYRIEDAAPAIVGSDAVIEIDLDPRFNESLKLSSDVTVYFDRYKLPDDCAEIVEVAYDRLGDGTYTPLEPLTHEQVANSGVDESATGTPLAWRQTAALANGTTRLSMPTMSISTPWSGGASPNRPLAPRRAPTVEIVSGGDLEDGATYRWAYTWFYGGEESGLSRPVAAQVDGAGMKANLSALEVTDSANYGRRRIIYRSKDNGPWLRVGAVSNPTTATFSDEAADEVSIQPLEHGLAFTGATANWLSFLPVPDQAGSMRLRYLRSAVPLAHDSDVPAWPDTHHEVIVWATVIRLLGRHADAAKGAIYEFERAMSIMRGACLMPTKQGHYKMGSAVKTDGQRTLNELLGQAVPTVGGFTPSLVIR